MNITIRIERSEEEYGSEEHKRQTQTIKSLAATGFPLGIMSTRSLDRPPSISFSGTITDFLKAIAIKAKFLASEQTTEDKKKMAEELRPIYEKSKGEHIET